MIKVVGKGDVKLGTNCNIGEGVTVVFKRNSTLNIADYVTLGDGIKIVVEDGDVTIGDWTTIHSNTLILCKVGVDIGRHCWFGQNTVLDGTGGLTIKDGVRVGMYSQIWTHVAAGEQIEGCKLFSARPTVIQKDVWLVGSCTVGSGITIGEKVICMNGSNITKSIPASSVALGAPAKVREGLSFYRNIDLAQKFTLMCDWITEFCSQSDLKFKIRDDNCVEIYGDKKLIVCLFRADYERYMEQSDTVPFCIETKEYLKTYSDIESKLIRHLSSNKARFYPSLTN